MEPTQEMKGMMVEDQQMIRSVTRMEDQPQGVATRPAAPVGAVTPVDLLRHALDSGADLDRLEKLMDLQVRFEQNEARKAFADDMARFKEVSIEIIKDKSVGYFDNNNNWVGYKHASIGNVVEAIVPVLAKFGFSHRWDLEQKDGLVHVTCVITHRLGHSQRTTLMANPDSSGKKNAIQSIISAKTYLERHTLLAATGLATKDNEDDDGAGAGIGREEREELRQEGRSMRQRANPADVAARRGNAKPAAPELLEAAQAAADKGHATFGPYWRGLKPEQRAQLSDDLAALQDRATKAGGA